MNCVQDFASFVVALNYRFILCGIFGFVYQLFGLKDSVWTVAMICYFYNVTIVSLLNFNQAPTARQHITPLVLQKFLFHFQADFFLLSINKIFCYWTLSIGLCCLRASKILAIACSLRDISTTCLLHESSCNWWSKINGQSGYSARMFNGRQQTTHAQTVQPRQDDCDSQKTISSYTSRQVAIGANSSQARQVVPLSQSKQLHSTLLHYTKPLLL